MRREEVTISSPEVVVKSQNILITLPCEGRHGNNEMVSGSG